jgi:hypothetical protein
MFNAGQNIALQDLWRRYEEWARCPKCGCDAVGDVPDPVAELSKTIPRRRILESQRAYRRRLEIWKDSPTGPRTRAREDQVRREQLNAETSAYMQMRIDYARKKTDEARVNLQAAYDQLSPEGKDRVDTAIRRTEERRAQLQKARAEAQESNTPRTRDEPEHRA